MKKPPNFQSMILALHKYWADQNCLIWHPYYSQVGAGTMNPATFLRVLGPEPFNVGYVEPSVRPDDGRYGDNPNRLQMFYQYQVILKPDPGNPQELYLGSLEAIGIDPNKHDIRFVEDNWESPALGAWGLGWEVWLDGLEITQFTYFQQAGRQELDPVSVELTYGLDRIAAPLQGVNNFKDIMWDEKHTFGDLNLQGEREHSKYYFEVADVERTRKIYDLTEQEVKTALEAGLLMPAYDNILKLSHLFNVLDSRGAIGVTERQEFFRGMRALSGKAANLYLEERERLEYPWLEEDESKGEEGGRGEKVVIKAPEKAADFILEIGTEELPPADLDAYLEQLGASVPKLLEELHLEHGEIKIMGTPRRLTVSVERLAPKQPDREEVAKGPPAARAFDADGNPTKAAEGFARGKGLSVKDLEVKEIDGGEYVVAEVKEKGRSVVEVLAERLPGLIAKLKVDKTMRWNASNVAFSRPIRWILALHGTQVIPFEYAGYASGAETRGLRFTDPESVTVKDAGEYFATLEKQGIILDADKRWEAIEAQIDNLAKEVKGEVKLDPGLLAEVTHLVEAPTALRGDFEKEYLKLPPEVLVMVMKKHQRYFPVYKDGKLLPHFITVRNGGDQHLDIVARGNEDVIRARFADAAFFVEEDLKKSLEDFLPELDTMTFQKDLGSYGKKTERIRNLVESLILIPKLELDKNEKVTAISAAVFCKADLVTNMVTEMTALQGIIGEQYALIAKEKPEVASAIREHYLPRFAGDEIPKTKPGLVLGLADRLDTLAGLFTIGLKPTGNKDPFALRRTALGLIQNLIAWDLDVDLSVWVSNASGPLDVKEEKPERLRELLAFISRRMQILFTEEGFRYDVVEAILGAQGHNPASAKRAVEQLTKWVKKKDWHEILPEYSRCVRITRDQTKEFKVDPKLFTEDAEKALFKALETAEKTDRTPGSVDDFLNAFEPMIPAVKKFFDDVLVMVEDKKIQENRLGLLQRIAGLADGVADMSRLEGF